MQEYREYIRNVRANARALSQELQSLGWGDRGTAKKPFGIRLGTSGDFRLFDNSYIKRIPYWSRIMGWRIWGWNEIDISFFNYLLPGEKLKLRQDVHKHLKIRVWTFVGFENEGLLLLYHGTNDYIWGARVEDIDWDEYWERNMNRPVPM